MIISNPDQFSSTAAKLRAMGVEAARAENRLWRRVLGEAVRTQFGRPAPGVTPEMIYGAAALMAEMLSDPSRHAQLQARGEAMGTAAPPTIDDTPCEIVIVLPEKADAALCQALTDRGFTCHTDARKTRGINCCLWQGYAAPSIVTPLVQAAHGRVVSIGARFSNDAADDEPDLADAPSESEREAPHEEPPPSPAPKRRGRIGRGFPRFGDQSETVASPPADAAERRQANGPEPEPEPEGVPDNGAGAPGDGDATIGAAAPAADTPCAADPLSSLRMADAADDIPVFLRDRPAGFSARPSSPIEDSR